ncbi:MAG: hypothetical protein Q9174_003585 [Haloplaca sp. 1 TL-2023]
MSVFSYIKVPSLASLYVVDSRLPGTADYTPLRASKRRVWSPKEKQVLHILSYGYQNPPFQLWQVFNAFFSHEYRHGARPRRCVWEAMRNEIKRSRRLKVWWTKAEALALRSALLQTARSLNIRLSQSTTESSKKTHVARARKVASPASSTPKTSETEWSPNEYGTPDKRSQKIQQESVAHTPTKKQYGLLTPPSSQNKAWQANQNTKAKATRPPIVFRAFNPLSQGLNGRDGFIAGKFIGAAILPITTDESFYLSELERHLAWNHRGVTSFVSVSQNLLRVLRHTVRSRGAESSEINGWQIALIDMSKVTGSVRAVWETNVNLNLDGSVPADFQREFRQNVRRAFGEWIVWGKIPASAVLNIVRLTELFAVMCKHNETFYTDAILSSRNTRQARMAIGKSVDRYLTYDDGLAIGRLLLFFGIPRRYVDHSIQNVLLDWRYPENQESLWKTNQAFVQGYKDAYNSVSFDFQGPIESEDDLRCDPNYSVPQLKAQNNSTEPTELLNSMFPVITERHNPADIETTFADFLSEIEDAAFGG